jgi:hypothetical protein
MLNPVEKLLVRHGLPIVFDRCKLTQLDFGKGIFVELEDAYEPISYCIFNGSGEQLTVSFMDGNIILVQHIGGGVGNEHEVIWAVVDSDRMSGHRIDYRRKYDLSPDEVMLRLSAALKAMFSH